MNLFFYGENISMVILLGFSSLGCFIWSQTPFHGLELLEGTCYELCFFFYWNYTSSAVSEIFCVHIVRVHHFLFCLISQIFFIDECIFLLYNAIWVIQLGNICTHNIWKESWGCFRYPKKIFYKMFLNLSTVSTLCSHPRRITQNKHHHV